MYDLIIIGSGPAGMGAAIYGARAELNMLVLEQNFMSGGQVVNTYEVDNYAGLPGISGMELATRMQEHCEKLGVKTQNAIVNRIEVDGDIRRVVTDSGDFEARAVIIASGADHSKLGLPGEDGFAGRGVSYCATCDGAFYRKKTTAVIGGGNVAVEDAIFLANLCEKVYVVHRRDELRADKVLQTKLLSLDNVEMVWNSNGKEILGDKRVNQLVVTNKLDGSDRAIDVNGVFIAVGIEPKSEPFRGLVDMDAKGFIVAGEDGRTSVPGIFAAGDIRTKALRQVITAVSDGANCIKSVQDYLMQ